MPSATKNSSRSAGVEKDLDELTLLLGETFRGLKQSSPPPQELREAAARGSLGPRHMPALLAVAEAGPLSVSELARRLGLSLSTTSAIVGDLSRAELLERSEDEADRRRTIVRLYDTHREVIASWGEQARAPLRGTLERLSQKARAQFMEGWRVLHEEATRTAPTDADGCSG
jgi:DNA-binding MarR family transcriptional regulator